MTRSIQKAPLLAAVVLLALASQGFAQTSAAKSRIHGPILDSDVVTLIGNTHPMARSEFDQGAIPGETRLERMVLVLQADSERQKQLDALVEAQQEQGSTQYHRWLTPAEFGSHFGASAADVAKISSWLVGHGFTVEPVAAGHRSIVFSGTAAQVAEAFHTEIHRYAVHGQMHIANAQDPQIPKPLAPVVAGIVSLHDFRHTSALRAVKPVARPDADQTQIRSENTQGGTHYLFPADYAAIYDLNPLYAAGKNGAGASIAIVGRSNINLSDVASFRSMAGLTANAPTITIDGPNPGLVQGDQDEATLDVEWSGAVGAGAAVKYVVAGSTATTDGVDLSANYIVNNKTAPVMSTSFGSCEADLGVGAMTFYNNLWEQAASEGISAFVSSGDSGAAGCDGGSSTSGSVAGVNGLCSSPYSTCVGGTEFNEGSGNYWAASNGTGGGSALGYIPEMVWNESASDGGNGLWSSGGGISQYFQQPTWQVGVSGANGNGMRTVPDVALSAAGHDGYLICENGNWYVVAGTSAASPSFAGILSIVVAKQGGTGQGNANPTLYGLLDASENPFHATPSGNNSVPGVTGFTAGGAAYNLATGLGSVDANLLATVWPTSGTTTPQGGFTLQLSAAKEALLPGKSTTFTVAVNPTGQFTNAVNLTAKVPSGVMLTFAPASVYPGTSAMATLTVAAGVAVGTDSILITGASGSNAQTATLALTVQAKPTLTIATAASKVALTQGKTTTLLVTATTGGSYSGSVTFGVSGLPSGVTAAWSAPSSASGSNGISSTLTLRASSTAASGAAALKITAVGDGLTAQTAATLTVSKATSLALVVTSAAVTVDKGKSVTDTLTIATTGAFTGPVTFAIRGLPTGVTASLSASSWTPSATSTTGTVTLTLKAVGTAAIGTSTIKIAANGSSLSAIQQITLKVAATTASGKFPEPPAVR